MDCFLFPFNDPSIVETLSVSFEKISIAAVVTMRIAKEMTVNFLSDIGMLKS